MLLLVGALLFGNSFYVSFTTGAQDFLSVPVIGQLVIGTVLMVLGYRFQITADELQGPTVDRSEPTDASPGSGGDDEFDPALSPVGETLEHLDEEDGADADDPASKPQ